jgi:hypothetical protein
MKTALLAVAALSVSGPLVAQQWFAGPAILNGVDHHATFITSTAGGPTLHVIGGNNYREQFASHIVAPINRDGTLGLWREDRPLPGPRAGHAVVIHGSTAFAIAGQLPSRQNSADVQAAGVRRDGSFDDWRPAAPLPAPRFHHAAVTHGAFIYVLGGLETNSSTNTVFRARVTNDTLGPWERLDTMPRPRSHQAALVHRGAIYQVGGLDGNPAGANTPLGDIIRAVIRPDGSLGPWQEVGRMDSAYGTHGAFIHDDRLYVAGGVENNRRFVATVQSAPIRRDGTLGAFLPGNPLPEARAHVHHLPVHGRFAYSVGGSASRAVQNTVWIARLR